MSKIQCKRASHWGIIQYRNAKHCIIFNWPRCGKWMQFGNVPIKTTVIDHFIYVFLNFAFANRSGYCIVQEKERMFLRWCANACATLVFRLVALSPIGLNHFVFNLCVFAESWSVRSLFFTLLLHIRTFHSLAKEERDEWGAWCVEYFRARDEFCHVTSINFLSIQSIGTNI